jgi:hypothetical protein
MGADKSTEGTQNGPNLSAQIVCPRPKVWYSDEKRLHWASIVRAGKDQENSIKLTLKGLVDRESSYNYPLIIRRSAMLG